MKKNILHAGPEAKQKGRTARQFFLNSRAFWWFEILYKLLGVTLFVPLLYGAFDLAMMTVGYRYLTLENLGSFLLHPVTYIAAVAIVILGILYTLVDMSAAIYILHCSKCGRRTDISDAIRFAARNTAAVFRKGNRSMFAMALLMLPFFSIGQIPEMIFSYSAPNNILLTLKESSLLIPGCAAVFILLCFPFCRLMYSFWYFTLENMDAKRAYKKSAVLGKGHHLRDISGVFLTQLFLDVLYILCLVLGILAAVLIGKLVPARFFVSTLLFSIVKILIVVLLVIFTVLGTPVTCMLISALFYRHKEVLGEENSTVEEVHEYRNFRYSERERRAREKHRMAIGASQTLILLATVSTCIFYVYQAHKGELNPNVEFLKTVEVTAHRGASRQYPENTMAAFRGAIEAGADWIELDVHQSKDGQIFVMHDNNFRRTAGVNAYAWELTYNEIAKLDAGSFFSKEFAGERIPLLYEVIDLAKESGIRLNIEIKPSPQEAGLEENLVRLLEENDFTERCVVTSQSYSSITAVKELDEMIITAYVTGFAYGNVNRLIYADNFSVKTGSITPGLVRRIHNAGKQVYAWTANTRDSINLMIDRQVDNIITDNTALAKNCIARKMASDTVNNLIQYLNRKIRLSSFRFSR